VTKEALKKAVLLASPLLGLLLAEAAFRYRAHRLNRDTLTDAFSVVPRDDPGAGRVRFRDIIQPSASDRIVYELRPGLDTTYKGAVLRTNARGLRSPEVPLEAPPGTLTILGLGASNMFGRGVGDDDLYTLHLERLLRERYPQRGWRVVNTAVPSYNVVQKVETLKRVGLAHGPDFVLLHVASNNLDLPGYIRVQEDPLVLGKSFLLGFLQERYELAVVDKSELGWNRRTPTEKIPDPFRDLVGWEPFYAAMDELAELGAEHGFEVLTFAYLALPPNRRLIQQAAERGFHATLFLDDVVACLEEQLGGEGYSAARYLASDLVVGPGNSHPSPRLHRLTAEWVLRELEQRGVIERLLAKELE
jgi:hypothetical protein